MQKTRTHFSAIEQGQERRARPYLDRHPKTMRVAIREKPRALIAKYIRVYALRANHQSKNQE